MRGIRQSILVGTLSLLACVGARAQDADLQVDLAAMSPQAHVLAPRLKSQVLGARIGWEMDDIRTVFKQASLDGRPVIIVADGSDGGLFANVLRCPTFNTLAGQAHFILIPLPIVDESSDSARLANAMHMDTAFKSTISVLEMRDRQVNEVLRLAGYQGEADLLGRLEDIGFAPMRPNPLPLSSVAFGPQQPHDCEQSALR